MAISPRQLCALAAILSLLAGCAQLLPTAESEVRSPWSGFESARASFERIEPGRTTGAELRAAGIDPYRSPNVQLLSFSDILLRFPISDGWSARALDEGLRLCLEAGKQCTGYSVNVSEVKRDRTGNFMLDMLGFRREVDVTGWSFTGLVLLVDDRVVYSLYGGQPRMHTHEVSVQPLGPLQSIGEAAASTAVK